MITLIWAQDAGGDIGKDGTLPWHLPEDMARFRELTMGATVVMGRTTWESLPERFRPLPGRRNLVLTRSPEWTAHGAEPVSSIEAAIDVAGGDLWVIGGGQVYDTAMPHADRLIVTELADGFAGDTAAPVIDDNWSAAAREPQEGWSTSSNGLRYRVTTYTR